MPEWISLGWTSLAFGFFGRNFRHSPKQRISFLMRIWKGWSIYSEKKPQLNFKKHNKSWARVNRKILKSLISLPNFSCNWKAIQNISLTENAKSKAFSDKLLIDFHSLALGANQGHIFVGECTTIIRKCIKCNWCIWWGREESFVLQLLIKTVNKIGDLYSLSIALWLLCPCVLA